MTGEISPLSLQKTGPNPEGTAKKTTAANTFADLLKGTIRQADQFQQEADEAAMNLLSGDLESIHELMIATEQAQLSLQLTVQTVNKVIQAYQEIYRMQV